MSVIYKKHKIYLGIGGRDLCYIEGIGYYPNPKAAQDYIDKKTEHEGD